MQVRNPSEEDDNKKCKYIDKDSNTHRCFAVYNK